MERKNQERKRDGKEGRMGEVRSKESGETLKKIFKNLPFLGVGETYLNCDFYVFVDVRRGTWKERERTNAGERPGCHRQAGKPGPV